MRSSQATLSQMAKTSTIIDAHLTWIRSSLSENTAVHAQQVLQAAASQLPCGLLQTAEEELVAWLAHPGWSPQTRASYRQHLCRFFGWAAGGEHPWISFNPAANLRPPRVPKGLPNPATDDQVRVALGCRRPVGGWALLAAYQGLRCIEIARLHRADIDELHLRVRGKGGAVRLLPTHPEVWQWASTAHGLIVEWAEDELQAARRVSTIARHRFHRAGAPISMHRLRHWYATTLLRGGANLRVVQELMRHASVASTQVYTQVGEAEMRAAVGALPALSA